MTICAVYTQAPSFPPNDQQPGAVRVQLDVYWVDYLGDEPTFEDVLAQIYPEPAIIPPHLNNGGLARFSGTAPATILENIGMSGVTRVAKSRYRVTHTSAMPSDQYSVMASVFDANPRSIRITARTATYVEVRVIDATGAAQDAAEITIKTERVIS